MYIKTLELSDFRNYDNLSINFGQDTNILYGDNAQGKTNVLESVYLAATTRSHRGSKDKEIIRFGKEEAHIKMIVMKNEVPVRIDMHLKKNKPKGIAVNGIPLKRASELFGILNVVFFSPEDLNVIKNGPAERRKFIDTELCQLDKIYLHDLISYGKILNQRNRLLKDIVYAKVRCSDSQLFAVPGSPIRSNALSVTSVAMAISTSLSCPIYFGVITISPALPPQI